MEDTEIVRLYFQRSEEAIAQTQKKYGHYLSQVAYNILHCQEDTEEVVGDTYWAAWNAIPPTRPNVLKHFLSRITRNLSYDRMDYNTAKRRNPHMTVLFSELDECLPDRRNNTEKLWEAKQIGVSLNRFLGSVTAEDCAIFLSRYYYAMSVPDISQRYHLPQRKVKYRLSRLRQQLRSHLQQEGVVL